MTDSNKYSVLAAFLPSQTIEILGKLSDVERTALARVGNSGVTNLANLPAFMMRVIERCADFAVNMTSRPASVERAYDRLRENADRLANILETYPTVFEQEEREAFLSAYRYAIRLCGWTLAERDEDGEADMFGYEHLQMDDVTLAAQITEVRKIFSKMRKIFGKMRDLESVE